MGFLTGEFEDFTYKLGLEKKGTTKLVHKIIWWLVCILNWQNSVWVGYRLVWGTGTTKYR